MTTASSAVAVELVRDAVITRNDVCGAFFEGHADRIARLAREVAGRMGDGGRLLATGRHQYATDAQHIEVEFVHPVLVGKRALPALDLSAMPIEASAASLRPADVLLVLGPPEGDGAWDALLDAASALDVLTVELPGGRGEYSFPPASVDPFVHQETSEILYHTLWESVHVFLESVSDARVPASAPGAAAFLYPFLGGAPAGRDPLVEVGESIRAKVAENAHLRSHLAREQAGALSEATVAIHRRVTRGGRLLVFGNGGSATDANDWVLDCLASPKGGDPIPAISLSAGGACMSAVANDVGTAEMFVRPLIAHAAPQDVAIGISTSGGSRNVIAALQEARRRGLLTVALLGHGGGEVVRGGVAEHPIVVGSASIPRIQEIQATTYHVMLDLLAHLRCDERARA